MHRRNTCTIVLLIASLLFALTAMGGVPQMINYQGRVTDAVGSPLDTTTAFTFYIYADSLATKPLWNETHPSVTVAEGLFSVMLGAVTPIPATVFDGDTRWLEVRMGLTPISRPLPIVSVAYAHHALGSDTAGYAKTIADNSVTSAKIVNGTIQFADIGQNGATTGQVMKWKGSAWAPAADSVAAAVNCGWVDNGTIVGLSTGTDTVAVNTSLRLGKLNVGGNFALNATSSIYFGNDSTRIKGYSGDDMQVECQDFFVRTRGNSYFGKPDEGVWFKIDNTNKRLGLATNGNPDDRLHLEDSTYGGTCWLRIQGSHATNWGQTGLRIQTPANTWHLRQDLYSGANFPLGALSLYSSGGTIEAMTWLEDGRVGIGTTNPTRKLHVYGSIQVKDTLYGGAIKPSLMAATRLPDEPGVASVRGHLFDTLTVGWKSIDTSTIDVPASGYVIAIGTVKFSINHSSGSTDYVEAGISTETSGVGALRIHHLVPDATPSDYYVNNATATAVFEVASAGPHLYHFLGHKGGPGIAKVLDAHLILLYVPTAYGNVIWSKSGSVRSGEVEEAGQDIMNESALENTPIDHAEGHGAVRTEVESNRIDYAGELRALRTEVEALKRKLEERDK